MRRKERSLRLCWRAGRAGLVPGGAPAAQSGLDCLPARLRMFLTCTCKKGSLQAKPAAQSGSNHTVSDRHVRQRHGQLGHPPASFPASCRPGMQSARPRRPRPAGGQAGLPTTHLLARSSSFFFCSSLSSADLPAPLPPPPLPAAAPNRAARAAFFASNSSLETGTCMGRTANQSSADSATRPACCGACHLTSLAACLAQRATGQGVGAAVRQRCQQPGNSPALTCRPNRSARCFFFKSSCTAGKRRRHARMGQRSMGVARRRQPVAGLAAVGRRGVRPAQERGAAGG